MSTAVASKPLSANEVDEYRTHGIVIPKNYRLSQGTVGRLQSALERLLQSNSDIRPEQLSAPHIARRNDHGVVGDQTFLEVALSDEVLDAVEQVIGPDIILWGSQVFAKPGKDGKEVPWHQDGHYWPIRPLATVSVWIALDVVDAGNGCMRVIPDSHTNGLFPHVNKFRENLVFDEELDENLFDAGKAMDVCLQPGEFSMHDIHLIHGSNANTSGRRRAGFVIRYMPATSHFDRAVSKVTLDFSRRPIWLARGVDRCGKNDFQVGHDS